MNKIMFNDSFGLTKAVKEQVQVVPYESGYLRSLGLFKIVKLQK